jgi:hypothetical protein
LAASVVGINLDEGAVFASLLGLYKLLQVIF